MDYSISMLYEVAELWLADLGFLKTVKPYAFIQMYLTCTKNIYIYIYIYIYIGLINKNENILFVDLMFILVTLA